MSKAAAGFVIVVTAALGCGTQPLSVGPDASDAAGTPDTIVDASDAAGTPDANVDAADASDGRRRGAGCGKPFPDGQQATVPGKPRGYTHFTVMGTGATLAGPQPQKAGPRTFWVRLPNGYDPDAPDHAYRVVYIGQGCGGYNIANVATYQLYDESAGGTEQAIYVALDIPTDMANQDCYDTRDGPSSQEWEAFELIHTFVDHTYCVDNDQVFVAGFQSGATLANMWGCYFAGDGQDPSNGVPDGSADATGETPRRFAPKYHIRGQAAVAGDYPATSPPCNGPSAAIWMTQTTSNGVDEMLSDVLKRNGCESEARPTTSWHPELMGSGPCVRYLDCPKDYPVVICKSPLSRGDDHQWAVPAFKLFFDEATASP